MPTYYPLQTKVQLHTSTLAETTTSAPERRKGPYATYKTDKAAMKIQNGRVLKETPIAIDDDESRLHFIGPNSEVPFFLMHAGEDNSKPPGEETVVERALRKLKLNENRPRKPLVPSFSTMSTLTSLDPDEVFSEPEHDEEDVAGDSTPRASRAPSMTPSQFALELEKRRSSPVKGHRLPAGISSLPAALPDASTVPTNQHSLRHGPAIQAQDPTLTPQALGLSFSFSDKSFLRSFDKQDTLQDVKIDVYVNGDFTESTTVPARQVVENKSKVTRGAISQIITGKRIHHMVERAWVLVPPHQNADGSMRPRNRSRASLAGPEERWNQVNAAILDEADKLGFNNRGERSPVGAYLASLAALPMPAAVEEFQKAGGPKFGVIDIAISVGIGRKFGPTASYLMEPTRMTDKEFVPRPADDPGVGSDVPAADTSASTAEEITTDAKEDVPSIADESTDLHEDCKENLELTEPEPPALPQVLALSDRPQTPPNGDCSQVEVSAVSLPDAQRPDGKLDPPILFPAVQSPSIESSPESDFARRDDTRSRHAIGLTELHNLFRKSFESASAMSSSQRNMPPPQTPLSSFSSAHKRRRSDAIQFSETELPAAKRQRGSHTPVPAISNGDSSGGPIGITRRGRFTRNGKDLSGSPRAPAATETSLQPSPTKTSLIRRVIIKNQGQTIVDRQFAVPLPLFYKEVVSKVTAIPSSPVYPLPESVVFSTRNLSVTATSTIMPPPIFHPPTPQPSSSPTRQPRQSRLPTPRQTSKTSVGQRRHVAKAVRDQIDVVGELHAAWKIPELGRDCVVSFAEDGPWRTGVKNGKGGVWRQIRSARPGYFHESEVLFGVRYLIG